MEGPLPNSKALQDARIQALERNKWLCGNVVGLQPFVEEKQISKKTHKVIFLIIFPILGTILHVLTFLGILLFLKRKVNGSHTNRTNDVHIEEVFSISTFDVLGHIWFTC